MYRILNICEKKCERLNCVLACVPFSYSRRNFVNAVITLIFLLLITSLINLMIYFIERAQKYELFYFLVFKISSKLFNTTLFLSLLNKTYSNRRCTLEFLWNVYICWAQLIDSSISESRKLFSIQVFIKMVIDRRCHVELKRDELFFWNLVQNLFTYLKNHEDFEIPRSVDRNTLEKNRTRAKNAPAKELNTYCYIFRISIHFSFLHPSASSPLILSPSQYSVPRSN